MHFAEPLYGSDSAGLVWAYRFGPEGGAPMEGEDIGRFVQTPAEPGHFAWLHFSLANAASARWLRDSIDPPDAFFDALNDHSSTRIEMVGDALLGVVNDMHFFAAEASNASTVTLYVTDRWLISARTTPLRAIDRLRTAVKSGELFRSPPALLAHLLRDQADVLADVVRETTRRVDEMEDRVLARQRVSRPELGGLRRALVRLQRLLAPEPAALFRLLNRPPAWLTDDDVTDLRHSAEELTAAVGDSAALVERIRLLQEELVATLNEQTNRTLFVLTVVTVLALPMTIIPGLFGMNVAGVPFSGHAGGFWIVLTLVVAVVVIGGLVARRYVRG